MEYTTLVRAKITAQKRADINAFVEGYDNGADRSDAKLNRWLETAIGKQRVSGGNLSNAGRGKTADRNDTIHSGAQEGNRGQPSGRGKKNSGEVKFSRDTDSEGRKLSEGQLEYFENSKACDEDGNLQVVYHGTASGFTVFDRSFSNPESDMGSGFYFIGNSTEIFVL